MPRLYRIECACGHAATIPADDWPQDWKIGNGDTPADAVMARMRCTACGRKGAPKRVLLIWGME